MDNLNEKSALPSFPLQVFFDGSCVVCATEIEHYLHQEQGGQLLAVDISAADFDPEPYHISQQEFMHELHVIDNDGHVYKGVEAFVAIWQAFPPLTVYRLAGAVLSLPLVSPVAGLLYKGFAAIRPYLPKRKSSCTSGICRMNK